MNDVIWLTYLELVIYIVPNKISWIKSVKSIVISIYVVCGWTKSNSNHRAYVPPESKGLGKAC